MLINSAVNTGCSNPAGYLEKHLTVPPLFLTAVCSVVFLFLAASDIFADEGIFSDASCKSDFYHEQAVVKKIIDGDTIILADKRHIRLIGINTPEINHETGVSQPGAEVARDYLSRLLHPDTQIHLVYDKQRKDRYRRTLAHLFLQNGINVQSRMLSRGLATSLTIPPNTGFLECYASSMLHARSGHIGLWAMKQYQPRPAGTISRDMLGYRLVTGRVTRVTRSKSTTWINLDDRVAVRISRQDVDNFDKAQLATLEGSDLLVQGWLYYLNGEYRMRIRHPVDIIMPANRN